MKVSVRFKILVYLQCTFFTTCCEIVWMHRIVSSSLYKMISYYSRFKLHVTYFYGDYFVYRCLFGYLCTNTEVSHRINKIVHFSFSVLPDFLISIYHVFRLTRIFFFAGSYNFNNRNCMNGDFFISYCFRLMKIHTKP